VAFAEDLLHGKRHDHHLKALRRAGKAISAMGAWPGLSEAVGDVKSLLATEQKEDQKAQQAPPPPPGTMTPMGCPTSCSS
jgi:hypothetical protein